MKKKVLALILATMTVLVGCGQEESVDSPIIDVTPEPIATEAPAEVATPEPTEAPKELVLITDREVVDGKMQSYLTGEWKDAEVVQRRSIAVMTPNNQPAIPHYGISLASVIYEAPMEKESCTRLMAIYEDYDELDIIGPVRSSRDYFVYEAMAFDSVYVNWGLAVPYVAPLMEADRIDHISEAVTGQPSAYSLAFTRRDRPGYITEFTGYVKVDAIDDAISHFKYDETYDEDYKSAFTFADSEVGCRMEYADYEDATMINPGANADGGGYEEADSYFEYDEETHLYTRYQHGDVMIDEYNDEEITVSNVIIKVCYGEWRDPNGYLAFGVHGTGKAYVFTNGKVIEGTWVRNSDYEHNVFLDENGEEIVLNQGKTWICNVMDKYESDIEWK